MTKELRTVEISLFYCTLG